MTNVTPMILLIMGVAGSGKTTTGQRLAKYLGWDFRDGDTFHPPANIAKMTAGEPLTDDDRWPWLDAIGTWIDEHRRKKSPAIVTCSALKRTYRHRLTHLRPEVRIIYLKGSKDLIARRMANRHGHFMPPSLLDSQFATLEEPQSAERPVVVDVAIPPSRVIERIIAATRIAPLAPARRPHTSSGRPT